MANLKPFKNRLRGVTLIELMIAVAIMAIVVALALPNYRERVRKANRTEATSALLAIAAGQERFYVRNNSYTTDLDEFDLGEIKHFSLSVTVLDGGGFQAVATPNQADPECSSFTIDHTGNKTYTGGIADNIGCW